MVSSYINWRLRIHDTAASYTNVALNFYMTPNFKQNDSMVDDVLLD